MKKIIALFFAVQCAAVFSAEPMVFVKDLRYARAEPITKLSQMSKTW